MFGAYRGIFVSPVVAAALLLVVASALRRDKERRREDFITAIGFAVFSAVAINLHVWLVRLSPSTYDPVLLRWDQALGFNANWLSGLLEVPVLGQLLLTAYQVLPLVVAAVWLKDQNRRMRYAILMGGLLCWPIYFLVPAVGPRYYDWANHVAQNACRNAMPSMHLTWALLLVFYAPRKWKGWLVVYAVLVAVSTVALGQHYLVDLIAAIPFTVVVQWMATRKEGVYGVEPVWEYYS
jgi:membrane-associated phospholipid phosphatase